MSKHINSVEPQIICTSKKIRKIDCEKIQLLCCQNNRIKMLINTDNTDIVGLTTFNKVKDYSRYRDMTMFRYRNKYIMSIMGIKAGEYHN
jgi:hypothetical protein